MHRRQPGAAGERGDGGQRARGIAVRSRSRLIAHDAYIYSDASGATPVEAGMNCRAMILLLAAAAVPARAATGSAARPAPACEAFSDERELRFRAPARTVTGHVVPGSVSIEPQDASGVGMVLTFGHALIAVDGSGERLPVSFAFWQAQDGCGGWEPARGATMTFDLADDHAPDQSLRVMRAGVAAGAAR